MTIAMLIDQLGRLLLGGLFVYSGIFHFSALEPVSQMMRERGVPQPRALLILGSVYEIALGVLLIIGFFRAPAALGLALFTLAASVMMVDFWNRSGPERIAMRNAFLANIAIIGGLLVTAASDL
jgi:putative oxidoreductase